MRPQEGTREAQGTRGMEDGGSSRSVFHHEYGTSQSHILFLTEGGKRSILFFRATRPVEAEVHADPARSSSSMGQQLPPSIIPFICALSLGVCVCLRVAVTELMVRVLGGVGRGCRCCAPHAVLGENCEGRCIRARAHTHTRTNRAGGAHGETASYRFSASRHALSIQPYMLEYTRERSHFSCTNTHTC